MKPILRTVKPNERPLAVLSRAEKLAQAKAYLQRKQIYILDRGAPKPKWGQSNTIPAEQNEAMARRMTEADRRRGSASPSFLGRVSGFLKAIAS